MSSSPTTQDIHLAVKLELRQEANSLQSGGAETITKLPLQLKKKWQPAIKLSAAWFY